MLSTEDKLYQGARQWVRANAFGVQNFGQFGCGLYE
jgi:hypothetical protein